MSMLVIIIGRVHTLIDLVFLKMNSKEKNNSSNKVYKCLKNQISKVTRTKTHVHVTKIITCSFLK